MSTAIESSPSLTIHYMEEPVGSTQDEARRLLKERRDEENKCLAVVADEQTMGRGTQGRKWESGGRKGNLYLTI